VPAGFELGVTYSPHGLALVHPGKEKALDPTYTYMEYNWVALFLVGAFVLVVIILALAAILRPSRPDFSKLTTYECGEQTIGSSWIRFNTRYYVIALMFLVFDVDVVFIFPWAAAFRLLTFGDPSLYFQPIGRAALGEMVAFLGILLIAWLYAYKRGALEWV
jgi:NADH-quinone oxidoreductase subunit A